MKTCIITIREDGEDGIAVNMKFDPPATRTNTPSSVEVAAAVCLKALSDLGLDPESPSVKGREAVPIAGSYPSDPTAKQGQD